jgi:hypothetical protein
LTVVVALAPLTTANRVSARHARALAWRPPRVALALAGMVLPGHYGSLAL